MRFRPAAFAGTFVALVFAATIVTACLSLLFTSSGMARGPARDTLNELSVAFTVTAVYMAIFVVASTMALSVGQRQREAALLRAIGARPWQIRRMVAAEAFLLAVPAAGLGYGLGLGVASVWLDGMIGHGIVASTPLVVSWIPLLPALGMCLATSLLGGLIAAHRVARTRPSRMLRETVQRGIGPIRAVLGIAALIGGSVLTSALMSMDDVGEEAPLVLLLFLVGVGLLGPALARVALSLAGVPLRLLGVTGELAALNGRAAARRLASAITPVALTVAFGLTKLGSRSFEPMSASETWMENAGLVIFVGFAAISAANTLVMVTLDRRRELILLRLAGGTRRQVRHMVCWETLAVAVTGLAVGTAIATITLIPLSNEMVGHVRAILPATLYAGTAAVVLLLCLLATGVPLIRLLRQRTGVLR